MTTIQDLKELAILLRQRDEERQNQGIGLVELANHRAKDALVAIVNVIGYLADRDPG